jgi:hypothetical protein
MTDDFDLGLDLRDRLARLAGAAPVRPMPALAVVPVARVQRRAVGLAGLAPILAVITIGTVVASLAHIGPFATGSSQPNGAVSATTRSGDFVLQIDSARARYAAGEQISVGAGLTYGGPTPSIVVGHAGSGPIAFGIVEPINGLVLEPSWRLSCSTRSVERGVPIEKQFAKSGGFDGADPSARAYASFFADSQLRLPAGTWHLYAVAQFSIGECGPDPIEMRAEITIEVVAGSAVATPKPTAEGETDEIRPESTVTSGDFELTLKAAKARFSTTENIGVVGSLTYNGLKNHITIRRAVGGPIGFVVPGLPNGIETQYFSAPFACIDMTLERGVPFEVPLQNVHSSLPTDFSLPQGSWQVRAGAGFDLTEDCSGPGESLETSIVFDVADEGPVSSPSPVGEVDVDRDDHFELRLQSDKSAYFSDEPIDVRATIAYLGSDSASYSDSIWLGGVQTDGANRLSEICCGVLSCLIRPARDLPVEVAFVNSAFDAEGPDAGWINAFRGQPLLHLAPGRWRLTAMLDGEIPGCRSDASETHLQVSIDIAVLPSDTQIQIDPEPGK